MKRENCTMKVITLARLKLVFESAPNPSSTIILSSVRSMLKEQREDEISHLLN